jgi:hypothetical protein
VHKRALILAAVAVGALSACKKTGDHEYQVVTPGDVDVKTDTHTVKTPDVDVVKDTQQVVVPKVQVKKDTATMTVPKVRVKKP